ncbi:MAG: phosphoribosylanthranilate isomerase [Eubacteriales bacterium]|nr:phosphoribosylanthranilate isomerase [Eubacteriales bacterium]
MSGIKICGLFRDIDIDYVNEAMPDCAGFILYFPKSHRNIDPERARELISALSEGIKAVGVFVDLPLETVAETASFIGFDAVQLHGHEDRDYILTLREKTGLPVWKAFRVRTGEDLEQARLSPADEVILDNGYGTGETFDWDLLGGFSRKFILAGGLTPENIPEALRLYSPGMIDISSGVETDRKKDREKIIAAVRAVRTYDENKNRKETEI